MSNLQQQPHQVFRIWKIFRGAPDFYGDGVLIAENCLIQVDKFNVLCVFDTEQADLLHWFPLNDADSIVFNRIQSGSGKHQMGKLVITGRFSAKVDKVTFKLDLENYNQLIAASQKWE